MADNETDATPGGEPGEGSVDRDERMVWFLVDRPDDRAGIESVARRLESEGVETRVVTITEVIGSAAREAVAGGAERILRGLRVAWEGLGREEDFLKAIRRERPDLLVVTSSRYVRPLSLLEGVTGTMSLQVGVPLNFNVDRRWLNGSIEAFIVPDRGSREDLAEQGFGDERLFVAGPPLHPNFEREVDREAVREELGFGDDSVSLVRAESFDATTLDRLVFQATIVEEDVRFIFHHNGDGAVSQTLRRAADKHGLPAAMFGRVSDLERYVHAADVVLASPAEPLLPEIVATRRPLFLIGAPDGYEPQTRTLTDRYGAKHLSDVLRFGSEFERFLEAESVERTREAIAETPLAPNNADVAEALGTALERVDTWKTERTPSPETPETPEGPETGGVPAKRGPFESIGTGESGERRADREGPSRDGRVRPNLSRAEAKDQLAELILTERKLQRRLSELEREQERWRNRLDLAREWGEDDLADEAEEILREYIDDAEGVRDELEDVRRQKEKLKEAARRGGDGTSGAEEPASEPLEDPDRVAELEERFSEMEIDRELDDLRDRIEGEMGD